MMLPNAFSFIDKNHWKGQESDFGGLTCLHCLILWILGDLEEKQLFLEGVKKNPVVFQGSIMSAFQSFSKDLPVLKKLFHSLHILKGLA